MMLNTKQKISTLFPSIAYNILQKFDNSARYKFFIPIFLNESGINSFLKGIKTNISDFYFFKTAYEKFVKKSIAKSCFLRHSFPFLSGLWRKNLL